jgi:hypothetical protein
MSRTIEVDFLPQAFDEAKEKPHILIMITTAILLTPPNSRWRGPGVTPFGKRMNQPGLTKRRNAFSPTLSF